MSSRRSSKFKGVLEYDTSVSLILLLLFSLSIRVYFWKNWGTLQADGGGHSIGGVLIVRTLLNSMGDPLQYAHLFISHYWKSTAIFFWPYGYDIATTISFLVFGVSDFATRLPNRIASVFLFYPVYLLAKEIYEEKTGLVAATVVAIAPFSIAEGGWALIDLPLIFLLILAAAYFVRATNSDRRREWLLAGLLLGAASWMKPTALVYGPPLYGIAVLRNRDYLRNVWYYVSGILAIAIFAVYPLSGIVVSHVFPGISEPALTSLRWFGHALSYAEPRDPTWRTFAGWTFYLKLLPAQLGWGTFLFASFGVAYQLRGRQMEDEELMLLAAIPVVFLVFVYLDNKNPRYVFPYLPIFGIFAAKGATVFASWLSNSIRLFRSKKSGQKVAVSVIVVILITTSLLTGLLYGYRTNHTDAGIETAAEILTEDEPGLVVVHEPTNAVAVSAVSFYVAANDPTLEYSVSWYTNVDEATWIISTTQISREEFRLFERIERDRTIYLYKRQRSNGTAKLSRLSPSSDSSSTRTAEPGQIVPLSGDNAMVISGFRRSLYYTKRPSAA